METGNGDFLMSDILFCHVLSHHPKIVIIVVKSVETSLIAAHFFECLNSEAAKTLYGCYYNASNKYKLERYRMSKRRTGEQPSKSLQNSPEIEKSQIVARSRRSERVNGLWQGKFRTTSNTSNLENRALAKDRSNINVIEITGSDCDQMNSMLKRVDENGVTHIEIDSAPCSLSVTQPKYPSLSLNSFHFLSALEKLSMHSMDNPDSYLNSVAVTASCPNSLIQTSQEIIDSNENDRKSRQREPPKVLKKEQGGEKPIVRREARRPRSRSEETRKGRESNASTNEKTIHESFNIKKQLKPPSNDKKTSSPNPKETDTKSQERQSRSRSPSRHKEFRSRPRSTHNKRPAPPPPPPRRHPSNPSLMLVPTKSGQEHSKAHYPKESHMRGNKVVRVDYTLYPPWNMNADVNNNKKVLFYSNRGWYGSHEFHSSRRNESNSIDIRKRSRSKSPARRPMAHRYMDAVSTVSNFNITQKIKDLSDSVKQTWKTNNTNSINHDHFTRLKNRKEKKMNPPLTAAHFVTNKKPNFADEEIRPVIKKGRKIDSDDRRVTFSAYATVQLMDN